MHGITNEQEKYNGTDGNKATVYIHTYTDYVILLHILYILSYID